jgi:N-acetylglutamate synthase-like GNAT family acetyltransferase
MQDLEIVDLREVPEHIPRLAEWHHAQWSYLNPGKTIEQRIEKLRNHLHAAPLPRTFVAVAEPGTPAGSASLVSADMDTLTPWLASVFVDPHYRQQGIGAALVRRVMAAAEQAGIETLSLFTPDQEAFYRQLGWHTIARERYRDDEVTIMQIHFPHP